MPSKRTTSASGVMVPASQTRLLGAVVYSESAMPALRLARSSRFARRLAKMVLAALLLTILGAALTPWQQSVRGSGSVIAFAPLERQQVIEAPIEGRIVRLGEGIHENARVTKGAMIAEIRDLDEDYATRLVDQLRLGEQQVAAARSQLEAAQRGAVAAQTVIEAFHAQVSAYDRIRGETIAAQDAYVEMAEEKVRAEIQQLEEYRAGLPQLEAEYERLKMLHEEGNIALQKVQEVERKLNEQKAKIRRGEAYVASAEADLDGKKRERTAKAEKAQIDIDYAKASLRKAEADFSKSEGESAKAQQELSKAEKDLSEAQIKLSRQQNQIVEAPFDGFLVKITPNLGTALVHKGDAICTIVPDTTDRAVQIWLDGNDAPLVEAGRHVRLQFEGWPAIQFSGWPSVAVGTFGGEVVSVDSTDDGNGRFRALVRPVNDEPPWPSDRFLRQGVRCNGWVLLDQVPLWFEIWRNLNGFPPVVSFEEKSSAEKSKPPKLPK